MKRRVKRKEHENLSDSNIRKVIGLLNAEKPITKKEACEILNISYNTTRLNTIIEQYEENVTYRNTRKAQLRGRPATKSELKEMIEMYLAGESFSDISKSTFRSVSFVKSHLERIGVPQRVVGEEKVEIEYLPEECVAENFSSGEIAWSAKYHSPCEVVQEEKNKDMYLNKYGSIAYRIWVREPSEEYNRVGGFFSSQLAYDLGKLEHLTEYGINTANLT